LSKDRTYNTQINNIKKEKSPATKTADSEESAKTENPEFSTYVILSPKGDFILRKFCENSE
jgi:hypothetical protein